MSGRRHDLDRRAALKLMASALAAATSGCSPPDEEIVPYAEMPEGLVAGEPRRFATTLALSGYGRGFLGVSVDGRPTKIEGNPSHPYSLGATDVFAEAEILSLYDPDRSRVVWGQGRIATWDDFAAGWNRAIESPRGAMALVTGRILSPAALQSVEALQKRFPDLRWYRYEPVNDDGARAGARLAFGRRASSLPRLEDADVVLTLDADPLGHGPEQLRLARAFSRRRGVEHRQRLYTGEPAWTLTGAAADFRLALQPAEIREIARLVATDLGASLGEARLSDAARSFAQSAGRALSAARGRALVLAGERQPPEVHALCHWINAQLRAPIDHVPDPDPVDEDHGAALSALAADLESRRISTLIVADANPVYDAPDALHIGEGIAAVPFSAHLALHADETGASCRWRLPLSHALESWGDALAPDGTASLVQPLIGKLHDTRSRDEVLSVLAGEPVTGGHELTRSAWQARAGGDFEEWWRKALHDGVIEGSAPKPLALPEPRLPDLPFADTAPALVLLRSPDPSVWDGRFANNAWLQECPRPFTKEVWGNALQLAPEDALRLDVEDRDTVNVALGGLTVSSPVIVMPGQAQGVVALSWGQGRISAGTMGNGIGARSFGLGAQPFARALPGIEVRKSAKTLAFRSTQDHTRLSGPAAELFQIASLAEASRAEGGEEPLPPSLLPIPPCGDYAWAMVVDTDLCIGCNACVVACQAENNVPVVGPEEIAQGRDMHWLRVDAYSRADEGETRQGFQPVPCMHCELAPCEPVCPVEASVHDHAGLNVQVYNRCIGTRFCEANCPYKVRRFNWFAYSGSQAYGGDGEALKAQHNPDVSVRNRGVMEKCNYCLQRISRARRTAEKENRKIAEGEIVTACQAACPSRAIAFGDLNRNDAEVSKLRGSPRHYTLLAELNTRPRTTYLKRVYGDDGP